MAVTPIAVENGKVGQKVERKLLMTFVDVSDTAETPEWELQGRSVEDASVEYNHDTNSTTDILGKVELRLFPFDKISVVQ